MKKTPRIYDVTKKGRDRLEREESLNHHIPDALINKLANLRNVCYVGLLNEFVNEYKDLNFKELEEEYEVIKNTICRSMHYTFSDPFTQIVENQMKAALAETNFVGVVREKFIHPFQNFLLGIIIIDHFYEEFRNWFSIELCQSRQTCVEASWLLASIFHDRLKPLRELKGLVEFEEGELTIIIPNEQMYIQEIASLYHHLKSGGSLENWP